MSVFFTKGAASNSSPAKRVAYFAILLALTITLQFVAGYFKIGPVQLNPTLVPLVLCGMILGFGYSVALGAVIGVVYLIMGISGMDPFTGYLFSASPVVLSLVCVLKTAFAGGAGALLYGALKGKNKLVATFISAGAVPVVNTGIFVLGMLVLKQPLFSFLTEAGLSVDGLNPLYVVLVVVVTWNFFVEFGINLLLAPAVFRVITALDKGL